MTERHCAYCYEEGHCQSCGAIGADVRTELCSDCTELAAEAAAERLHEGEPPTPVTERAQLANQARRRERGY